MTESEILKNSVIGKDYLKYPDLKPTVDQFLDYRFRVSMIMKEAKYPKDWLENELKAVDIIITNITAQCQ